MKKLNIIAFLAAVVLPLCILSCSEETEDENEFEDWKNRNEAYFQTIYQKAATSTDGSWKIIRNYTFEDTISVDYDDNIVVEVLEEGTGSGSPMFTDSVFVNYRGRLIPTTNYVDGYVFDQSYIDDYDPMTARPAKLLTSELVDGFATALQNMHIGDHWRVYIPYPLGYGASSNTGIPAYSTLIFDIALVAYYRAGTTTDPLKVRKGFWVDK